MSKNSQRQIRAAAFEHPQIQLKNLAALKAARRNARTHSAKQLNQIAKSIEAFGFVNPILVDVDGHIVAGHGRVDAARKLGLTKVPVICLEHLSQAELRAYAIADNRLAELAGWDKDTLALELADLITTDSDFDVSVTDFDHAEIDLTIQRQTDPPMLPMNYRISHQRIRRLRASAHYGSSDRTASFARMSVIAKRWDVCWMVKKRGWCLPIRPTTFRSMVTYLALDASATANLRWAVEK